jgi:putative toxin-antitoxin system antitoxin component (TIGR02293 family)
MAKKVKSAGKAVASGKYIVRGSGVERTIPPNYTKSPGAKSQKRTTGNLAIKTENTILSKVEEPALVATIGIIPFKRATEARPEFKLSSFEKMELIEEGISKKALEKLKEKAKLDYDQLSKILNVARATLINKKGDEKFSADVSDKILGLADIYSYGYEVLEDRDKFNEWIFSENKALGGKTPFDLLHNTFGREEVKHLIGRIDYGIYS